MPLNVSLKQGGSGDLPCCTLRLSQGVLWTPAPALSSNPNPNPMPTALGTRAF